LERSLLGATWPAAKHPFYQINRKPHSGYKVIFVSFKEGIPFGEPVDVLTVFSARTAKHSAVR
jgi:hypothetical protein